MVRSAEATNSRQWWDRTICSFASSRTPKVTVHLHMAGFEVPIGGRFSSAH
jgi:hypothetical protein